MMFRAIAVLLTFLALGLASLTRCMTWARRWPLDPDQEIPEASSLSESGSLFDPLESDARPAVGAAVLTRLSAR